MDFTGLPQKENDEWCLFSHISILKHISISISISVGYNINVLSV